MLDRQTTFSYQLKEYKSNRNPVPQGQVEMTGYLKSKVRQVINKNQTKYGSPFLNASALNIESEQQLVNDDDNIRRHSIQSRLS